MQARSDGQDKFHDPISLIFPPAIPSWRRACEEIDVKNASFVYQNVHPTDLGYIFPEPAMFVRAQSSERREVYFLTWLKYRMAFLYRVSSRDSTATPMPTAVWRDVLSYESSYDKMGEKANQKKDTKSSQLHAHMLDFLQNCIEAEEVTLIGLEKGVPRWNGSVVETLSDAQREEILWELSELNFRFELLALDSRATTSTELDRQALIAACFPGRNSRSLLVANLGMANHGLADINAEERALYLHGLKRLMMEWRGDLPAIIKVEKFKWTEEEIDALENAITSFYVKSFYNYFRRPPVVPRRLSHVASSYHPPEPPKITVLDPQPRVFYDVSTLHPM